MTRAGWWLVAWGIAGAAACTTAPSADEKEAAVPTPKVEREAPPVNTLKWTTASEVDNFGFDVYRSNSEDGPFERITAMPIPGAGTTDEPQSYVWVDDTIDPRQDYYYYIESISMASQREPFSPVIRAPAKEPPRPAASPELE
jgi:hypothetical protein